MANRLLLKRSEQAGKHHLRSVALVPAELEFAEVLSEMLPRYMSMSAANAALQQRPEALCAVDVVNAINPLLCTVINRAVRVAMPRKLGIGAQFIGADRRADNYVFENVRFQCRAADIRNNASNNI